MFILLQQTFWNILFIERNRATEIYTDIVEQSYTQRLLAQSGGHIFLQEGLQSVNPSHNFLFHWLTHALPRLIIDLFPLVFLPHFFLLKNCLSSDVLIAIHWEKEAGENRNGKCERRTEQRREELGMVGWNRKRDQLNKPDDRNRLHFHHWSHVEFRCDPHHCLNLYVMNRFQICR